MRVRHGQGSGGSGAAGSTDLKIEPLDRMLGCADLGRLYAKAFPVRAPRFRLRCRPKLSGPPKRPISSAAHVPAARRCPARNWIAPIRRLRPNATARADFGRDARAMRPEAASGWLFAYRESARRVSRSKPSCPPEARGGHGCTLAQDRTESTDKGMRYGLGLRRRLRRFRLKPRNSGRLSQRSGVIKSGSTTGTAETGRRSMQRPTGPGCRRVCDLAARWGRKRRV